MVSNFNPPVAPINVEGNWNTTTRKLDLPTSPRSFQVGSPMWTNGSSGVEPALQQAGDSTNVDHANSVLAPKFVGFANNPRIPQQLTTIGSFNVPGGYSVASQDASTPWIGVTNAGTATGTCDALGSQQEIGAYVQFAGFQNEASTGFYDCSGTLRQNTLYYLYNNKVQICTNSSNAIGSLVERALSGQTYLRFQFKSGGLTGTTVV